jgi:hypothetical protein
VQGKPFEYFIMAVIIGNSALMATSFYGQPAEMSAVVEAINYAFTGIYVLEFVLKVRVVCCAREQALCDIEAVWEGGRDNGSEWLVCCQGVTQLAEGPEFRVGAKCVLLPQQCVFKALSH